MKEDKSDEWIASSLKKHLEEGQLPYEIGAWEEFQKVRNSRKRRASYYWMGAVAASLLLLVGISQVFFQSDLEPDQELVATEMRSEPFQQQEEKPIQEEASDSDLKEEEGKSPEPELLAESHQLQPNNGSSSNEPDEEIESERSVQNTEAIPSFSKAGKAENLIALEEVKELEEQQTANPIKEEVKKNTELPTSTSGLIATLDKQPEAQAAQETVVKIKKNRIIN
ncbi:hypothetical protein V8V91_06055 [Algoriphagus halophilus]|uniref:hypothetical protein n=1 Tax=Algoriphagus halophilus TaxID=226505 RepID=UPI00358E1348